MNVSVWYIHTEYVKIILNIVRMYLLSIYSNKCTSSNGVAGLKEPIPIRPMLLLLLLLCVCGTYVVETYGEVRTHTQIGDKHSEYNR